ncbi:MAG: nickel ABC transporter ATP-binding protein [Bacteroidetes bacterium HGW-Bacteroidetes-6]|jgi:cobalt/nickel transport system ATP-binding protein|nr:MAG: nickel ABC transporter ATP-binding protein [Bacteroidetes bacterium HGW-Bacteroidetes-6]
MENIFELKNIGYSYFGKIEALKGINLEIRKGEMLCIMGQNGSGKSTLLSIINGLIFPDEGEVLFDGEPITEKSLRDHNFNTIFRQKTAFIFQNPDVQLFCNTVFEELLFAPLQLNISQEEAEMRATEMMKSIGIEHLKDRSVISLSGGEKKKVAIASALTINPELILVDEPLAGLDPKAQTFVIELLLELNRAGKTIVFSTHHLDLVDHLQPRVAVLSEEHGIRKTGTAAEILNDEEFLISVNLIHEHIHKHGDEVHKHYHSHYVFHKH